MAPDLFTIQKTGHLYDPIKAVNTTPDVFMFYILWLDGTFFRFLKPLMHWWQALTRTRFNRGAVMLVLIIAGESIFLLPFILPRIFRPTMLEVFGLTNFELGSAFSVYGISALVAYLAGGPIADRFSARKLMAMALFATAFGAFVLTTLPGIEVLVWLYGFWGLSTILLFWAAMLRYTRLWGGSRHQGSAYGLLDGGRGLVAALLASGSVYIFSTLLPVDPNQASLSDRQMAMITIIWLYGAFIFLVGILIWFLIPEQPARASGRPGEIKLNTPDKFNIPELVRILKKPPIWLNALIVLCAYVGYKCTDDFSLYVFDTFNYDEVRAAQVGTISFWIRPVAAIIAGFLADRVSSSKIIFAGFMICIFSGMIITLGLLPEQSHILIIMNIALTGVGIYGIRGVYFALFGEGKIPLKGTGTAIGIISVIGFTPDIFMGPLMGYFLDEFPGAPGHQYVFGILTVFSCLGIVALLAFRSVSKSSANNDY